MQCIGEKKFIDYSGKYSIKKRIKTIILVDIFNVVIVLLSAINFIDIEGDKAYSKLQKPIDIHFLYSCLHLNWFI